MTDTATLMARLAEAEAALHELSTGARVVQVRNDLGEQVSYQPADRAQLSNYIADLKCQLGRAPRRAIAVRFR